MSLGGPLPRASMPSGGSRAIARLRLPRDRAAYGVSSHSGNARYRGASGTGDDPPSSLATAANTRERRKRFGRPHLCRTRMNSLRLERVCSPSSPLRALSLVAPQFPLAGYIDRPTPRLGYALTSRMTSDLRPSAPQRRADPAAAWSSLSCPLRPSPADQCATVRPSAP